MNARSQNYKFTSKERDAESGLDNFGFRYYGGGPALWWSSIQSAWVPHPCVFLQGWEVMLPRAARLPSLGPIEFKAAQPLTCPKAFMLSRVHFLRGPGDLFVLFFACLLSLGARAQTLPQRPIESCRILT